MSSILYEHKLFVSVIPVYANDWHRVIDKMDFKNRQKSQWSMAEKKKKKGKGHLWSCCSFAFFWICWHYAEREGGWRRSGWEQLLAACSPLLTSRDLSEERLGNQKDQWDEKKMATSIYELLGIFGPLNFPFYSWCHLQKSHLKTNLYVNLTESNGRWILKKESL